MSRLAQLTAALDDAVAGVYATDGRIWTDMRWHGERTTPAEYAEHAARWRDQGARVIGWCCVTDPCHIRGLGSLKNPSQRSSRER